MSNASLPPRHILTLTKNPPNRRTTFRNLKHANSYFECKANVPVGATAYYSVRLTPKELEQARRDADNPRENLMRVEPNQTATNDYSYEIPNEETAKYMMLPESLGQEAVTKYDGAGIRLCVIDTGCDARTHGRYQVPPIGVCFDSEGSTPCDWKEDINGHGTDMCATAAAGTRISLLVARHKNNGVDEDISALNWAIENGAHIISMSFSYELPNDALNAALQRAHNAGILLFASMGNENQREPRYPAATPNVHGIANFSNITDQRGSDSNWGPHCWAAACGAKVTALDQDNSTIQTSAGGTSTSCQIAARIAALIEGEGVSAGNVISHMDNTARFVNGFNPEQQGNGVLQFQKAVEAATGQPMMPTDTNGKITLPNGAKLTPAPPNIQAPPPPFQEVPPGTQIQPAEPPTYRPPPYDPPGSFDLPGGGDGYSPLPDTPSYPIPSDALIEPFGGEEPSDTDPEGLCQQPNLPDEIPDQEQPPAPPPEPDEPDPVCALYGTALLIDLPLTEDNIAVRACLTDNGWYCDPPDCGGRIYAPPTRQNTGYILLSEIEAECEDLLRRINWTKTATAMYPPDYWWHCD